MGLRSAVLGALSVLGAVAVLGAAGAPGAAPKAGATATARTSAQRAKAPARRPVRRRAVPPRSPAELPAVDRYVSTTEGCVDAVTPAVLGARLGTDADVVRAFFDASGVPAEPVDNCVPYVAVTGGAEGVASLHLAGPPAGQAPPSSCEPLRRVIEVPAPTVNPERFGPLLDIPVRVRWQVEVLLPEMTPVPDTEGEDAPPAVVRLVLERRGSQDPERLQSIEVLDAATRRRIDAAWWVERPDGPGVLFGLNGTDYERLLWNSAVHFERVSRGVGPATRVETRVVRQGKRRTKKVVTRVVKPRGYHLGIDMMADRGMDVHAVADGTVAFAGTARGFGKLVILDHGRGYRTYYAHLAATATGLHAGDVLLRGDVLGLVGSTGHSTGPHLHFETRLGNDYIDPRDGSRQLEFWILSAAEQAWVARQMLAFAPPVLPANTSMVVGTDGSVATHAASSVEDAAVCRAFAQVFAPERPELPKPVIRKTVRKAVRKNGAAKKPVAKRPAASKPKLAANAHGR